MIATNKIFLTILFGLSFWSCASSVESPELNTIKVNLKDAIVTNLSSIASSVKHIALETSNESLIGRIREVEHNDQFIFISDFNSLYQFSIDGHFIKKIGSNGQGPGEFLGIRSMAIDWENELIYLGAVTKLICLNFDGHLVKEVKLSMIESLDFSNNKLSVISTIMGLPSNKYGMSNTDTYRIEVSDNLSLGDTTLIRRANVQAGVGTIMPNGISFISEVRGQEFVYFPVPYQESIVRDTLFKIVNNQLVADTKIDFGIKDKITERLQMINILKTENYLITNYAHKGIGALTLVHLPSSNVFSVKGGFNDDTFGTGDAKLIPWDSKKDQFYYIKEAYDLEGIIDGIDVEGNPYLFIVQLKKSLRLE